MSEQAWGQFRSGMLRRVEFDRLFGVAFYLPPPPPLVEPVAEPVAPTDTDYAPSEVAGLGLPVPETPAGRAGALAQLKLYADLCRACGLHEGRTKGVFGVGPADARLMVIGEAPGKNEDLQGEPFVGLAGELLDRQLKAIHLSREQVYICNTVKCRPPGNRNPQPEEMTSCNPFLVRQIQLIQPELILASGKVAAHRVLGLGAEVSVGRMRGRMHDYQGIPVIVTYHPAYLLREGRGSAAYRKAWDDLKRVRDSLGLKQDGDQD